jgi:hypothetical protein
MKNKNLLIGGAVVAGLLFLYFRNRQSSEVESEERSAGAGLGSVGGGAISQENGGGAVMQTGQPIVVAQPKMQPPTTSTPKIQLTKFELEARLLKSCGVRPLVKGARRNLYNDCVAREKEALRAQGLWSFDGDIDTPTMSSGNTGGNNYLTFDGGIDRPSDLDFGGQIID